MSEERVDIKIFSLALVNDKNVSVTGNMELGQVLGIVQELLIKEEKAKAINEFKMAQQKEAAK